VDRLEQTRGGLTDTEREHLRPVINTRDVFPHGVVLPLRPSRMIWLPESHGGAGGAFPAGMPTFEDHLTPYKPLLEKVIKG
jgi:hypothetical protein